MIKKIVLFFFAALFLSFFTVTAQASVIPENSLNEVRETADNLKNIEKLPIVEDIGLIAQTIRDAEETYRSIKAKFWSVIDYGRKIVQTTKEVLGKIESGGLKIKKYIEDKIDLITMRYEINPFLI